jgi:hypothetical protein
VKIDKSALVSDLAAKGLTVAEDNPNLVKIARSLGLIVDPLHSVQVVHNVPKVGQVAEPTDKSKAYLAISGGARGRDAWFPIPNGPRAHVESMALALAEFAETLPEDSDDSEE